MIQACNWVVDNIEEGIRGGRVDPPPPDGSSDNTEAKIILKL